MAKIYGTWDWLYIEKLFQKNDIDDERDMVWIVLDSYWRHLNNQPVKFEEQVQRARN